MGVIGMQWAAAAAAATFTVSSIENDGAGSLRQCVADANAAPGADTIVFAVANSITVYSGIMVTDPVEIDGGGTQVVGNRSGSYAFFLSTGSSGSVIRNLAIVNCGDGIMIGSNDNQILNCRLGTDWNDTYGRGNTEGIYLFAPAAGNIIGAPGQGNVIAGNASYGIFADAGVMRTRIQGNLIGVTSDGNTAMANGDSGIYLYNNRETLIGGNRAAGAGNVISGNGSAGVSLVNCPYGGNSLCGNIIGLQLGQTDTVANTTYGVFIANSTGNLIGLPTDGYENFICGSAYGIYLTGASPRPAWNRIQNNWIGLNETGGPRANGRGIHIATGDANLIGGNRTSGLRERNIISGNTEYGIWCSGHGNTMTGNLIGLKADGSSLCPNQTGILITGDGNRIGGIQPNASTLYGNVVSWNTQYGVHLEGNGNTLLGNYIGLNAAGTVACPNQYGVVGSGGLRNTLGNGSPAGRNVISGNTQDGLRLESVNEYFVRGNYLGTAADGLSVIPNGHYPVFLQSAANCSIGGELDNRNLLCGQSGYAGVYGYMAGTTGNSILGNWINVLADGRLASPALQYGIYLFSSANNNALGMKATGYGNLIAGTETGIALNGADTDQNGFFGNTICSFAYPAAGVGILLSVDGANNNKPEPVILAADAAGISGTSQAGDYIQVFVADRGAGYAGGSLRRAGTATADGAGAWSLLPAGLRYGDYVCALASDAVNNTSRFSANTAVTGIASPTPTVTPTWTATATPTSTPTAESAGPTSTATPTSTPTPVRALEARGGLTAVPNPARTQVRFLLDAGDGGEVVVDIFGFGGERVAILKGNLTAGGGELVWDCRGVAAGLYLAQLKTGGKRRAAVKFAVVR